MKVLERSNGIGIGVVGQILVIYYEANATLDVVRALERASQRSSLGPNPVATLVVIEGTVRPPEPAVRTALQTFVRRFADRALALAYVIQADGFGGAAARAAITGMLLFTKPRYPAKVFRSIPDAVAWIASEGGRPMREQGGILGEIEAFCKNQDPSQSDRPA